MTRKKMIDIIIPTYKGYNTLKNILDALNNQSFDKKLLNIVVILNDPPKFREKYRHLEEIFPAVTFVIEDKKGRSHARNKALNLNVKNELILFIDCDVKLSKDWIVLAVKYLRQMKVDAIIGKTIKVGKSKFLNILRESKSNKEEKELQLSGILNSSNCLIKRSVFEKMGGFNPEFRRLEDTEFFFRFLLSGYVLSQRKNLLSEVEYPQGLFNYLIVRSISTGIYQAKLLKIFDFNYPIFDIKLSRFNYQYFLLSLAKIFCSFIRRISLFISLFYFRKRTKYKQKIEKELFLSKVSGRDIYLNYHIGKIYLDDDFYFCNLNKLKYLKVSKDELSLLYYPIGTARDINQVKLIFFIKKLLKCSIIKIKRESA